MDGTVVYDGRANVHVVGQRQATIPAQGISDLISALDKMDFLDTPESCCTCPAAAPYQIITLDYRPGSSHRRVVHDSGCGSAPPAITTLERTIDQVSGVDRWTTATVEIADRGPVNADQANPVGSVATVSVQQPDSAPATADAQLPSSGDSP